MLYFAYGSKMDFHEIRKECPSAQFVAVAKLANHQMDFTAYSESHGCGVADAVPKDGGSIWGVVYEIADIDFGRLDRSEGYQPGRPDSENDCLREQRHVWRDGHEHDSLLVWLYLARRKQHGPMPSSVYKGVLVHAAQFWHLPANYVEELQRIEAV